MVSVDDSLCDSDIAVIISVIIAIVLLFSLIIKNLIYVLAIMYYLLITICCNLIVVS